MRVMFFGRFREMAAAKLDITPPQGAQVADIIDGLAAGNDALGEALRHGTTTYVLDGEKVKADATVAGALELAFLPPVSGG